MLDFLKKSSSLLFGRDQTIRPDLDVLFVCLCHFLKLLFAPEINTFADLVKKKEIPKILASIVCFICGMTFNTYEFKLLL